MEAEVECHQLLKGPEGGLADRALRHVGEERIPQLLHTVGGDPRHAVRHHQGGRREPGGDEQTARGGVNNRRERRLGEAIDRVLKEERHLYRRYLKARAVNIVRARAFVCVFVCQSNRTVARGLCSYDMLSMSG